MDALTFVFYIIILSFFLYMGFKREIIRLIICRKEFKCRRCGRCCNYLVRLSDADIALIKKAGKKDFVEYHGKVPYLRQVNGYCPFLSIKGGMSKCEIYDARPEICRNFPRIKWLGMDCWDDRCCAFEIPEFMRKI